MEKLCRLLLFLIPTLHSLIVSAQTERQPLGPKEIVRLEKYDDLEGAQLALSLALDQKTEAALMVLGGLSSIEIESQADLLDRTRGLLALQGGNLEDAERLFTKALDAKNRARSAALMIELTSTQKALGKHKACLDRWEAAPELLWTSEETALLALSCARSAGQPSIAWSIVSRARSRLPNSKAFQRERIDLLIELGLYEQARTDSLKNAKSWQTPTEPLALAESFIKRQLVREAAQLVEAALLKFPNDPDLLLALAQAEYRLGRKISSALLFELLATKDSQFHLHASELFRQQGWRTRAEYQHLYIADSKDRLKQKMGFALDRSLLSTISAMTPSLSRSGLLTPGGQNDDFIYASVYARFQTSSRATQRAGLLEALSEIRRPELMEKAVALRKTIEICQTHPSCN